MSNMAAKGGRPVDPIWQVFVRVSTDGKVAKCTECETMVSAKVERLRSHRQKCKVPNKECDSPCKFCPVLPSKTRVCPVLPGFYPLGWDKPVKPRYLPTLWITVLEINISCAIYFPSLGPILLSSGY